MDTHDPAIFEVGELPADAGELGYAGPPAGFALPVSASIRRQVRVGTVLSVAGALIAMFGKGWVEQAPDITCAIDDAYRAGHRAGWYERGEELTPAEAAERAGLDEGDPGADDPA